MPDILRFVTPTILFAVALLTALICLFHWYWVLVKENRGLSPHILLQGGTGVHLPPKPKFTFAGRCHPMVRLDWVLLVLVTVLYAATAFFQLGSTTAPRSFLSCSSTGDGLTVTLKESVLVSKLWYYPGLGTGGYNLEISSDGEHWSTLWTRTGEDGVSTEYYWADAADYAPGYHLEQNYDDLFKWLEVDPTNDLEVRYLRLTAKVDRGPLELGELVLFDENGQAIDAAALLDGTLGAPLFDDFSAVPDDISWYNSTYFDEIYHARTAYEHIRGIYPYEISHPPLGKLILSLGIQLFGMTPFGWRFMGTLFGVLMLPVLYLFLKNLFGKTPVAACGTALFAFDFMHLTQTRIATIDTYGVFFILLMYYFMYRYLTLPAGTSFREGAPWLFLSGLFWGIGAASKWTVIYGGAGLALLYFIGLWFKIRDWPRAQEPDQQPEMPLGPWLAKTLLFSVLCFVLIPVVIYMLSYLPYAYASGNMSLSNLLKITWDNQVYMLTYHQGVHDTHPYESRWYQWIVDGRPILYYLDYQDNNMKSAFAAFSNPVVCWGGLFALLSTGVRMVQKRCGKALFIVIAFFSQLAPWFFIFRTTFAYHYFPSILFLVFALCYVFDELIEMEPRQGSAALYATTGVAVFLYAAFYPVLIGLSVPRWYTTCFLQWFLSWPF